MTAPDHYAEAELNILCRRGPSTYDFGRERVLLVGARAVQHGVETRGDIGDQAHTICQPPRLGLLRRDEPERLTYVPVERGGYLFVDTDAAAVLGWVIEGIARQSSLRHHLCPALAEFGGAHFGAAAEIFIIHVPQTAKIFAGCQY